MVWYEVYGSESPALLMRFDVEKKVANEPGGKERTKVGSNNAIPPEGQGGGLIVHHVDGWRRRGLEQRLFYYGVSERGLLCLELRYAHLYPSPEHYLTQSQYEKH